jgi:protein-disulfide isomerase
MTENFTMDLKSAVGRGDGLSQLVRGAALALLMIAALASPTAASAQLTAIKVQDAEALKPPPGARVAIVEFDDLECPTCAHYNPLLKAAAEKYKIPWVRHDFIIPYHNWSRNAAVKAHWFDSKSKALGDEYRDEVFANQPNIYNLATLSLFTQQFAAKHGIKLPMDMDPQNKFEAAVQADVDLGKRTGVNSTPTIFVVEKSANGASYKQVLDPERDLDSMIKEAMADTRGR